jgi:hypothetical protein
MAGCKVDILVDRYDIGPPSTTADDIHEYLLTRWQGTDNRSADGYATLATWFNKRLMRRVYEMNGRETLGVRVESEFEALTGDDDIARSEVRDDLSSDGIDADRLVDNFVSRSTMRRHLNECLDGSKPVAEKTSDWERRTIEFATNQARQRITEALGSMARSGDFPPLDSVDIDVSVEVSCRDDPYQVPIEEAIRTDFDCE